MSEVKVNKISPRTACGTVTLGDSGDTFTIPSGATITNAGTASGFGATGETSWDTTVKTTGTFTATAGVGYFLNTTGGIITVNLPAGAAGSSVAMTDYAATWQTNNVTVAANGSEKIGGIAEDATLSTEGQSVTFVYVDGTQGWVNVLDSTSNVRGNEFMVTTVSGACNTLVTAPDCANTKIATFKNPGTFCVSQVHPCAANNLVSYMVVAGGGGGGGVYSGGGGGAGGFREYESPVTPYTSSPLDGNPGGTSVTVTASPYSIVVGGGGPGGPSSAAPPTGGKGTQGSTSTFSTIDSAGGGGGGGRGSCGPPLYAHGGPGGSGGGGGGYCASYAGCGGTGDTPPTTPNQGFAGGGASGSAPDYGAGGGGGATAVGVTGTSTGAGSGNGGAGATTSISASPTAYAGGGGGGATPTGPPGTGGPGGGGAGGTVPGTCGVAGGVNTGGGGGGGVTPPGTGANIGGQGGSGIVIIRYKFQ